MSLAGLFRHTLTIRRLEVPSEIAGTPPSEALDDWGHPGVIFAGTPATVEPLGYRDLATVKGLVQERTGEEIQGPQLQGTVVSGARIYLPIGTDIGTQDRVRNDDDGLEYDVLYVKDAAGRGNHLECSARRIEP